MKHTSKRDAINELNAGHPLIRASFYNQRQFCRQFQIDEELGLCAGLLQVWWGEKRSGKNAIEQLRNATPEVVRDVLFAQARSVYLKSVPSTERGLNATEAELLRFKYGTADLSEIAALGELFGAKNALELDLALQHRSPIHKRWMFAEFGSRVVDVLTESQDPGLRLLMIHFNRKKRAGQLGHRSGLAVEKDGSCSFYDPSTGEMAFSRLNDYGVWLREYWPIRGWSKLLERGTTDLPPIQIFHFRGDLTGAAREKAAALRRRLLDLPLDRAFLWINVGPPRMIAGSSITKAVATESRDAPVPD